MLARTGRTDEAKQLCRDLVSTCSTFAGPNTSPASDMQRFVANVFNNLAWFLASVPNVPYHDPTQALCWLERR